MSEPFLSEKAYGHGLVLGKFYLFHAGHQALIRAALRACDRVTVELLGSQVETIPLEVRAEWLREEHPTAHVVAAMDEARVDFDDPAAWDEHMVVISELLPAPVDAVFSSDAYGEELARRLDATWVQVDPGRVFNPVSGTAVRPDLTEHWAELPAPVRAWLTERVVVLGAESTGTTTLAERLAADLGTHCVPEYGRLWSEIRPGGLFTPGAATSSTSSSTGRSAGRTLPADGCRSRSWSATPTYWRRRCGTSATSARPPTTSSSAPPRTGRSRTS